VTGRAADRLIDAMRRAGAPACVGLDPVLERLPDRAHEADPAASIETFCLGVIEAIEGVVGVVKPQSACFERYGSAGLAALERVVRRARALGFFVILDAKRGDIGTTAEHYAAFAFDAIGADAVTVNPYMGFDTIEPFLRDDRAVFALVRTSNPGSDAIQSIATEPGETVAETVAKGLAELGESRVGERGYSDLGAVVAATKPDDAARLRELMPRQIFLVPGFGAQGGTVETVRALFREGAGAVINASRSVLYPSGSTGDWRADVRAAAQALAAQTRRAASPDAR
jgi:orotidine-5'-phosphate decarboxylase